MTTVARTPICSNALSPWPRIQFSDTDPRLFDAAQGNASLTKKANLKALSRNRGLSDTSFGTKIASQGRRLTFSSTPQHDVSGGGVSAGVNIDVRSILSVERSLKAQGAGSKDGPSAEHVAEASSLPAISDDNVVGVSNKSQGSTTPQPRSNRRHDRRSVINQGHTAALCWHMRLQAADGILVPPEFGSCTIHPVLTDQRPETPSTLACENVFDSPKSYSKHTSLTSTRASTAGSSTWVDSEISAIDSPTRKASERTLRPGHTEEQEAKEDEEADPFLHIGRQLLDQKVNSLPSKRIRRPAKCSNCTCTHRCFTYLSNNPSAHCPACRLPRPQPEIITAMWRLQAAEKKNLINDGEEWVGIGEEKRKALRKDSALVESYEQAIEKRCEKGVWWEGWIVVRELQQGKRA